MPPSLAGLSETDAVRTRTYARLLRQRGYPDGFADHLDPYAITAATKRAEHAERRLRELNHRVANALQIASSLVQAQRCRVADPLAREALNATTARLEAVARLHRHLCPDDGADRLDLGRFIAEIAPAMEQSTGLRCELDVEPVELSSETALHLAIAVNELVLNARKHAYADRDGGVVSIGCRRQDGRLRLTVADQGIGLPNGFDPLRNRGLGMEIVADTVRQLGGELRAENDHGARFTLLVALP